MAHQRVHKKREKNVLAYIKIQLFEIRFSIEELNKFFKLTRYLSFESK